MSAHHYDQSGSLHFLMASCSTDAYARFELIEGAEHAYSADELRRLLMVYQRPSQNQRQLLESVALRRSDLAQ